MKIIQNILTDKGSKYSVSGGLVYSKLDAQNFIKNLKRNKKFSKATHNTWGLISSDGVEIKDDDGEGGAGNIILRILNSAKLPPMGK